MEYLSKSTGLQAIGGMTLEKQAGPYGNVLLTGGECLKAACLI